MLVYMVLYMNGYVIIKRDLEEIIYHTLRNTYAYVLIAQ